MTGPKRREVGHGKLAHRALDPVFPDSDNYKYVVRCSSDVRFKRYCAYICTSWTYAFRHAFVLQNIQIAI